MVSSHIETGILCGGPPASYRKEARIISRIASCIDRSHDMHTAVSTTVTTSSHQRYTLPSRSAAATASFGLFEDCPASPSSGSVPSYWSSTTMMYCPCLQTSEPVSLS